MPRSVYSVFGRDGTSGLNPINLLKRFAIGVMVVAMALVGSAAVAGATAALATPQTTGVLSGAATVVNEATSTATTAPAYFIITATPGGASCNVAVTVGATCIVSGLTNGTSYTFVETAPASDTTDTASAASAAYIPLAQLATPVAVNGGTTKVSVSFVADGLDKLYTVTAWGGAGYTTSEATCVVQNTTTAPTGAQSCSFAEGTGAGQLTAGTSYEFSVAASDAVPNSTASANTAAFTVSANLATPIAADNGSGSAIVTFSADSVALYYTVTATSSNGGVSATCSVSAATAPTGTQTCTVTGLTNQKTYTFVVTPANGGTTSLPSAASNAIVIGDLLTPTAVQTGFDPLGSGATATVTFTADGVATEYVVDAYVPTGGAGTTASPYTYTGATAIAECDIIVTSPLLTGSQTCAATGLNYNTAYGFTVTPLGGGTTSLGSTFSAAIKTVNPLNSGAQPTAAVVTGTTASVTFGTNGKATSYVVNEYAVSGAGTTASPYVYTKGTLSCTAVFATAPTTSQSCTVTGLTSGTSYVFTVTPSGGTNTDVVTVYSNKITPSVASTLATPTATTDGPGNALVTFTADGVASTYTVASFSGVGYTTAGPTCVLENNVTAPTGTQTCIVTGLTSGTSYEFTVTPSGNSDTTGASAKSAAITASTALGTPTVANAGSGAIKVSFTADGSATSYTVTAAPGGATCIVANTTTAPTGAQNCTITGLTNGTAYTFTVAPTTSPDTLGSTVSASSAAIVPGTTPLATPAGAWAASGSIKVTFTADGVGSTYTVTAYSGTGYATAGPTCTVANSTTAPTGVQTCTVAGLTNGTSYEFVVTVTGNGDLAAPSAASAPVTATATYYPTAPTSVTATATANTIVVAWAAPTSTGNSPITGYVVTATSGYTSVTSGTLAATATTFTVSGLTPATTYSVTVVAINAVGNSGPGSATATTLALPAPVTKARQVAGHAVAGTTTQLTVLGTGFYGQPKIHSSAAGTTVTVSHDTGTSLVINVKVAASTRNGVYTFTIVFANGTATSVKYNQR